MSEGRGGGGVTSAARERPVGEVEVIFAVYLVAKWRRELKWNGFIGFGWNLVLHQTAFTALVATRLNCKMRISNFILERQTLKKH